MPHAGFKPGSLSDSLLEFENSALNCSATAAGYGTCVNCVVSRKTEFCKETRLKTAAVHIRVFPTLSFWNGSHAIPLQRVFTI